MNKEDRWKISIKLIVIGFTLAQAACSKAPETNAVENSSETMSDSLESSAIGPDTLTDAETSSAAVEEGTTSATSAIGAKENRATSAGPFTPPSIAAARPQATAAPTAAPSELIADTGYVDGWCRILNDHVTSQECARARSFAEHLSISQSGLYAPRDMYSGDTAEVAFAIVPDSSNAKIANTNQQDLVNTLGNLPTKSSTVATSRNMAAVLSGPGFEISPAGRVVHDLGVSGTGRWSWSVKALGGNNHILHLSVYAVMVDERGNATDNLIAVMSQDIAVKVGRLDAVTKWVADATALNSAAAKFLTAITALIVAAGGVWAAVRAFGKKHETIG